MNTFQCTICLLSLGALVVTEYDQGKTDAPPANAVGAMLSVAGSSANAVVSPSVVVVNVTGANDDVYDISFGRKLADITIR